MQAIDTLIRLGGRPSGGGLPLGFLGYYKRVENVDQMVPFFTCIPNAKASNGVIHALTNMINYVPSSLFPNVNEFIEKLGNTTIAKLVAEAMVVFTTGPAFSSDERSIIRSATSVSSWKNARAWDKATALALLPRLKNVLLEAIKEKSIYSLRAKVKTSAVTMVNTAYPEYQTHLDSEYCKIANDIGWVYGLYLPNETQNVSVTMNPEMTMKRLIAGVDKLHSCTVMRVANSTASAVSHFCYMGTTPRQPKKPYKFMGFFPKLSLLRPDSAMVDGNLSNTLGGVRSLFCLMIRAKARPYVSLMMMLGLANKLELEKGDLELWEDASLKATLGDSYKDYIKIIQSNVRNHMQSPVRVFPNLTKQLFDIEEAKEVNEVGLALEALNILTRAQQVANYTDVTSGSWSHSASKIKWAPQQQVRFL